MMKKLVKERSLGQVLSTKYLSSEVRAHGATS